MLCPEDALSCTKSLTYPNRPYPPPMLQRWKHQIFGQNSCLFPPLHHVQVSSNNDLNMLWLNGIYGKRNVMSLTTFASQTYGPLYLVSHRKHVTGKCFRWTSNWFRIFAGPQPIGISFEVGERGNGAWSMRWCMEGQADKISGIIALPSDWCYERINPLCWTIPHVSH